MCDTTMKLLFGCEQVDYGKVEVDANEWRTVVWSLPNGNLCTVKHTYIEAVRCTKMEILSGQKPHMLRWT
jgi:hypothetical protein